MIKMLTTDEVAEILGVSKPTAYNYMRSEGFPKIQVGRAWRVEEQLFLKWIQEQSTTYC